MKFKITLTPSDYYQDAKKSKYLNPVVVESLDDFKKVLLKDYACAVYKDNHRSIDDFLYADAISSITEQKANTTSFISLVKSCTEVKELDAKTLRIFVEKIIIHQKEKIDGVKTQKVEIIYNGIGKIQIPQEKA